PELFPTRVRATATAFVFNAPRLISWTGPLISGWLIANFGGFSQAAVVIATVYILGLAAAPFLPETRGKPLPGERHNAKKMRTVEGSQRAAQGLDRLMQAEQDSMTTRKRLHAAPLPAFHPLDAGLRKQRR